MNNTLIAAGVGCLVIASGCSSFERDRDFEGRLYVGAGALISQLDPDTDDTAFSVDDDRGAGGSALIGYDVSNRFSVEGSYALLGEAGLEPNGTIEYNMGALSALVYALNDREDRARREGFSVYGRAGVGFLDNSGDVDFEQVNDFNLMLGAGVEYGFRNGLGVRGELVSHDRDVQYGQLALVYRFGDAGSRDRGTPPTEPPATERAAPLATPVPAPQEPSVREPLDTDRDGVPQAVDDCPDTPAGRPVNESGCDLFDGTIEGVNFESGSDTLTAGAQIVLDEVAATLLEFPTTRVAIEAHTDNSGDAEANLDLSRRRALSVARYLVSQGVPGDRLRPRAFGESQPRVSNATSEGRAANRRVELRAVD